MCTQYRACTHTEDIPSSLTGHSYLNSSNTQHLGPHTTLAASRLPAVPATLSVPAVATAAHWLLRSLTIKSPVKG